MKRVARGEQMKKKIQTTLARVWSEMKNGDEVNHA
jgi:hypothetical protein